MLCSRQRGADIVKGDRRDTGESRAQGILRLSTAAETWTGSGGRNLNG
jgi:hypothetical protein